MRYLLALIATAVSACAAHVTWDFVDFTTDPAGVKRVTITPLSGVGTNNGKIVLLDRIIRTNAANGSLTVSNMVSASYRVDFDGRFTKTSFTNAIPDTDESINAADYISVSIAPLDSNTVYTKAQSNGRYVLKSGDTMTGALTNNSGFWYNGELLTNSVAGGGSADTNGLASIEYVDAATNALNWLVKTNDTRAITLGSVDASGQIRGRATIWGNSLLANNDQYIGFFSQSRWYNLGDGIMSWTKADGTVVMQNTEGWLKSQVGEFTTVIGNTQAGTNNNGSFALFRDDTNTLATIDLVTVTSNALQAQISAGGATELYVQQATNSTHTVIGGWITNYGAASSNNLWIAASNLTQIATNSLAYAMTNYGNALSNSLSAGGVTLQQLQDSTNSLLAADNTWTGEQTFDLLSIGDLTATNLYTKITNAVALATDGDGKIIEGTGGTGSSNITDSGFTAVVRNLEVSTNLTVSGAFEVTTLNATTLYATNLFDANGSNATLWGSSKFTITNTAAPSNGDMLYVYADGNAKWAAAPSGTGDVTTQQLTDATNDTHTVIGGWITNYGNALSNNLYGTGGEVTTQQLTDATNDTHTVLTANLNTASNLLATTYQIGTDNLTNINTSVVVTGGDILINAGNESTLGVTESAGLGFTNTPGGGIFRVDTSGNGSLSGSMTASSFSGSGAGITGLTNDLATQAYVIAATNSLAYAVTNYGSAMSNSLRTTLQHGTDNLTNLNAQIISVSGDLQFNYVNDSHIGLTETAGLGFTNTQSGGKFAVDISGNAYVSGNLTVGGSQTFGTINATTVTTDTLNATNVSVKYVYVPTNAYGGTVIDWSLKEATTNVSAGITLTGMSNFNPTNYNYFVLNALNRSGSDQTLTLPDAKWACDNGGTTIVMSNSVFTTIVFRMQPNYFTNVHATWTY